MISFVFPGQGSQFVGMGKDLFDQFPDVVAQADDVLGYSVKSLCLQNIDKQLDLTQFTQPALFVVNALSYLKKIQDGADKPFCLAGHSLGEFNALHAAGVFDFETGVKLVAQRGLLMSAATNGGMAAIIGADIKILQSICEEYQDKHLNESIQIANYNSPSQVVVSGTHKALSETQVLFEKKGAKFIKLNVSAAFHSDLMQPARLKFIEFIDQYEFYEPAVPVIANMTARAYEYPHIANTLADQITSAVKWTESISHILSYGDVEIEEIGPGKVLTQLIKRILKDPEVLTASKHQTTKKDKRVLKNLSSANESPKDPALVPAASTPLNQLDVATKSLGGANFKKRYGLDYAYVANTDFCGVGNAEIVKSMTQKNMLGVLNTNGRTIESIELDISNIQSSLVNNRNNFAVGVAYNSNKLRADFEEVLIELCVKHKVTVIEASDYLPHLSLSLVRYRLQGLYRTVEGHVCSSNRIIARISRPELAETFLTPPPRLLVQKLLMQGDITQEQASMAEEVLMADDICVETDSSEAGEGSLAAIQVPTFIRLRNVLKARYPAVADVAVGTAGGIGTPESAMVAYMLGADFVMTDAINLCTVEASTSNEVKKMLQSMNIQDTTSVDVGRLFETDEKVRVLNKAVFFPARAKKLIELYNLHDSFADIDEPTKKDIETKYFGKKFEEVCELILSDPMNVNPSIVDRAKECQKYKMALVFFWYISQSIDWAVNGHAGKKVDYQIQTNSALGAFNQWVKDDEFERWQNRNVDQIAIKLLNATVVKIMESQSFVNQIVSEVTLVIDKNKPLLTNDIANLKGV